MASMNTHSVAIEIGDEVFDLVPTLAAMTAINSRFGSFMLAGRALADGNFDAVVSIIRIGANLSDKAARSLPAKVFEHGFVTLLQPVSGYLEVLANGGRRQGEAGEAGEAGADAGNA